MKKQIFYAVAASVLALTTGYGCKHNEASASGNLGTVDGEPITFDEYYGYLQHMPQVEVSVQGRMLNLPVAQSLGTQAAQGLIQQKLLLEIAKDANVTPTKEDIDKELATQTSTNPAFVTDLENQGLSLEDIRGQILLSLAREKVITKGITVTADDAKKFITTNKPRFSTPAQAKLLVIVVPTVLKAQVESALSNGQQFSSVAMKYSTAPQAKQNGGQYPTTNVTEMPPVLQTIVKNTAELKTSAWQKDGPNWVKFYVQSKAPAKPMPVDDKLIKSVQRALAMQKGQATSDLSQKLLAKIKRAKVEISVKNYKDNWDLYAKNVNIGQGQPGAPSGAPTGPARPPADAKK